MSTPAQTLPARSTGLRRAAPWLAGAFTIIIACLLLPRIGITDVDAESYFLGARSLAQGRGYVDDFGIHLNHWPPGYSWLLSWWADPKPAALVINIICLGAAVALSAALALRNGWSLLQGLSVSLVLGFGLFLNIAGFAKPDILNYTVCLAAVLIYGSGSFAGRVAGSILCSVLIPIKMIAVTFAPALLLAELIELGFRPFFRSRWREVIIAGLAWAACLGWLLWYNARTLQQAAPETHIPATLHTVLGEAWMFCQSFFREGLATWYGSIRPLPVLLPFALVVVLGLACVASLRRGQSWSFLFKAGAAMLALSWAMEFYRDYGAGPRLMGYGMLFMMIGARPLIQSTPLWAAYAAATIIFAIANHLTTGMLGLNHPAYETAAKEAAARLPPDTIVYTNAWRLLEIHAEHRSVSTTDLASLPPGSWYWRVSLPNFDAIMRPVADPPVMDASWKEQARLSSGTLYRRLP